MILISTIFLFFCIVYGIVIIILYKGLHSHRVYDEKGLHSFSIIIAARNEEAVLCACLDSVLQQSIPLSRYEVIIVDDRSIDKTFAIANEYKSIYSNVIVKHIDKVPEGISPKKNAVAFGVASASKEIIVFTDADCIVPPRWLEAINRTFAYKTGLVQGITMYSRIHGMNEIFWGLQSVDFLSHGIVAASAIGAGVPLNSNANNFAFRRDAFYEIGGYGKSVDKVVSGDDDLLLQKIWKSKKWKIRFMIDNSGIVSTLPTKTAKGVFEQRKRWGSKTVHYNILQVVILSGIFLFYLSILFASGLGFVNKEFFYWALIMVFVKMSGEAILMVPGTRLFGQQKLRWYIIPASIIQLPMVIIAVLLGIFGKFNWKDQRFSRKVKKYTPPH